MLAFGGKQHSNMEQKETSLKGVQNGNCNRTACQEPPADYYNHSTRAWYCAECASKINRMNPESHQMFGHELCTHQDSAETIEALQHQANSGR